MISWHRFYDPSTGRYVTADPIGLAGGMNLYAYVGGNPINLIDLEGLKWGWGFEGSYIIGGGSTTREYDTCCKDGKKVKRTLAKNCLSGGLILYYKFASLKSGNYASSNLSSGSWGHCDKNVNEDWLDTVYNSVGGNLLVGGKDSKAGWSLGLGLGGYYKLFNHCRFTVIAIETTDVCCGEEPKSYPSIPSPPYADGDDFNPPKWHGMPEV